MDFDTVVSWEIGSFTLSVRALALLIVARRRAADDEDLLPLAVSAVRKLFMKCYGIQCVQPAC